MTGRIADPDAGRAAPDQEFLLPVPEFDLPGTLDGGQAFRWHREGDGYRGVIGRSVLHVSTQVAGQVRVRVLAGENTSPKILTSYLGLDFDLDAFQKRHVDDPGLAPALASYAGLRVLRQDPWECLCGFICSATSSIPRIKMDMQSVARAFGDRLGPGSDDVAFPGPHAIAAAGEAALRELGLGFRARYVMAAAEAIGSGVLDLTLLSEMPYAMAKGALVTLKGVGPKIADCVLAFSLSKGEAFPVDRWVRRAMEEWYGASEKMTNDEIGRMARERFGEDAAYANQYLFHRQRLAARASMPRGRIGNRP